MSEQSNEESCYFCRDVETNECLIRSLYHKHNDVPDKLVSVVDQIMSKEQSVNRSKFNQLQYHQDTTERLQQYYSLNKSYLQQIDLLQYYKYRKYVPLFPRSPTTQSIYHYYYQKLKIYYNSIKKQLNMTVDPTQQTQTNSIISVSSLQSQKSKVLNGLQLENNQMEIRQYQTQSKALENLVTFLKKNQKFKKVKTLKTQDCKNKDNFNPFSDKKQTRLVPQITLKNNKGGVFFRFIESSKKKKIEEFQKNKNVQTIDYPSFHKTRKNSIDLKQKISKNKSAKKLLDRKREQTSRKGSIKSLPKVLMEFNVKSSRSLSSLSLKRTNILSSKRLMKKQSEYISPYETKKNDFRKENSNQKKKKVDFIKTIKQTVQIEKQDNITSVRNKKLQMLKIKSKRKKEIKDFI